MTDKRLGDDVAGFLLPGVAIAAAPSDEAASA
jgi:hypothetical protein